MSLLACCIISNIYTDWTSPTHILWPQNEGVWADNNTKYNTKDWTLKSSYSYSILKELLSQKYKLDTYTPIEKISNKNIDCLLLITPTKPFNSNELAAMNTFMQNGGRVVIIADHTDLYGHAMVLNSLTAPHGICINYDAVFSPNAPYSANMLNDMFFFFPRTMTGCSLQVSLGTHVSSSFVNFVSERADYTRPNFFGDMTWTPEDHVGLFPFIVTKKVGRGTMCVCTDSTIFSNFAIFQPDVLSIVSRLFQNDRIYTEISDKFLMALIIVMALSILLIYDKKNQTVYIIIFCFLVLCSKCYVIFPAKILEFYPSEKLCTVSSSRKFIYEAQPHSDVDRKSIASNLLANLPRFNIYPYYVNPFRDAMLLSSLDLCISDKYKYSSKVKTLIVNDENTTTYRSSQLLDINPGFSDYYIGSWWTSINVSPYRQYACSTFARWLKMGIMPTKFQYPKISISSGDNILKLKNERSQIKELRYDSIRTYKYGQHEYVYIDNNVWGLVLRDKDKIYLLGGPSLNDKLDIHFYSSNWYGEVLQHK